MAVATDSFVYLIEMGGRQKIGKSRNPNRRVLDFKNAILVHVIRTRYGSRLETLLHGRFASRRVEGEWFLLDAVDVEAIRGLAEWDDVMPLPPALRLTAICP